MKYLLLFAFFIPLQSFAQVELVRPADFRYDVTVDGDTVSSRSLDYKAHEDAVNYRCDYPDAEIIIHPTGVEVRGECKESVADTAYVNLPPHDNSFLHSVDWTHEVDRETGEERIDFVIESDSVDSLITEIRCGNEWVKEAVFPDSTDARGPPAKTLHYGILWDCDSELIYQFRAHKGVWEQAITEQFPAFAFELTESEKAFIDSVKKKSDVEMAYLKITNDSLLWTNAGHDNAVFLLDHPSVPSSFWDDVSANGGNLRVYYWDGSQEIAVAREVVNVDAVAKTGFIYFDSSNSLASTQNEWRIYPESGATEPASSDPLGSHSVWGSQYRYVSHDGGATDATSNTIGSTAQGNVTPATVDSPIGKATDFSGNDGDFIRLSDADWQNITSVGGTESLTIQAVFNFDGVDNGNTHGLIASDDAGGGNSNPTYGMFVHSGTQGMVFGIQDSSNSFDQASDYNDVTTEESWQWVSGVFDGATMKNILDGSLLAENLAPGVASIGYDGGEDAPEIGRWKTESDRTFNGRIAGIRILDVALSEAFVETEFNNQSNHDTFWSAEWVEEGIDEAFNINQSSDLDSLSRLELTSSISVSQSSQTFESSQLSAENQFQVSAQSLIDTESTVSLDEAVSLFQSSAFSFLSDLSVDQLISISQQSMINASSQVDAQASLNLALQSILSLTSVVSVDDAISIVSNSGITILADESIKEVFSIAHTSSVQSQSFVDASDLFSVGSQALLNYVSKADVSNSISIDSVITQEADSTINTSDSFAVAFQNAITAQDTEAIRLSFSMQSQSGVDFDSMIDAVSTLGLSQDNASGFASKIDAVSKAYLSQLSALQKVSTIIQNEGFSTSSITDIAVEGSMFQVEVTLPEGRIITIVFENRVFEIPHENRIFTILPENRTYTIRS